MALTKLPAFTLLSTDSYTFGNATVTANMTAGNVKTDNLLYANGAAWTFSSYSNTNVQAYLPTYSGLLSGTLSTQAQPNITSVGTLASVTVSGLVTATSGGIKVGNIQDPSGTNTIALSSGSISVTGSITAGAGGAGNVTATYFIGNGSQITGLPASYANSNVAAYLPTYSGLIGGTLSTGAQPNVTSVGTLTSLNVTGNISTSANVIGNGQYLTSLTGGNVTGQVANALVAGTVYTNAQPNITSLGTLSSLAVAGTITTSGAGSGNISGVNYITANYFSGNGSLLTSLTGSNVTGQVGNSLIAGTVYTAAQPNITSVGTLTSVVVSTTANVGTLNATDSSISGNIVISGNLTVNGTTQYTNVTNLYVKDPIIEIGGGANGAALSSNDGKDRGTLLHYYTTQPVDAFMGWDNSNGEFAFGSNVTLTSEVATFNTFGNVRASTFIGALSGAATTAGTVTTAAQPNITSVGTLTSLNVTGNVSSGGNIIGNGQYLTSLAGENVTGQVANALVAGTVYTNAQPNITSVGTLTSVNVSGNTTTGNLLTNNLLYANGVAWTFSSYSNTDVQAYLPTYSGLIGGTLSTQAQPNVTSVGTLNGVTVSGVANLINASNVSLGPVGNIHISGGSANYVLQTDGSGTLSWTAQTGGAPALTMVVDTFTANGTGNTYTLTSTPPSKDFLMVNIDGVTQLSASYSVSGNVVTLNGTPVNGAAVEIKTYGGSAGQALTTGKAIAMAIVFGF